MIVRRQRACLFVALVALTMVTVPLRADAKRAPLVRPFVSCVTKTATEMTVVFGYRNSSASPITIPVGKRNRLTPPGSVSPPTTFVAGTVPVAFTSSFATNATPTWTVVSGKTPRSATVSPTTATCSVSPTSPALSAPTHGLTLTLDGKTSVFRFPVTIRPEKLNRQSGVLLAGFKPDLQAWSVLVGGGGLQVQFGWEERQPLTVGTFLLGACPSDATCRSTPGSYTAVVTDGRPETTLLAYDLPALALEPVTLKISSVTEAVFPNEDATLAPVTYRYVQGTIEGKIASVVFAESGPVFVRGPLEAKVTFDIYVEELKK
jgi:hypothetical protein